MTDPRNISIDDYDYCLPETQIAQFPAEHRDHSKLLIYKGDSISSSIFQNLPQFLPENSLIIFNETKVIHARLIFHKPSGSRIEVFCLEPVNPLDIHLAFRKQSTSTWKCFVGNAKKWKDECLSIILDMEGETVELKADKGERIDDVFLVHFNWSPSHFSFSQILESFGRIPLPPYINRESQSNDSLSYQTMYAKNEGSVAAPTAGLHFTPSVMESLSKKNILTGKVTLHVGAGTFKPVSAETLEKHQMHSEQVLISIEVIEKLLNHLDRPVILVGTTTVRSIESIYWQGVKWLKKEPELPVMSIDQWDPYLPELNSDISLEEALYCVFQVMLRHKCKFLKGSTSLLIAPGYKYRVPTAIITNFHQPRSTLLLLVSAFIGPDWRKVYDYALLNDFRFLSYGDSCLFFRQNTIGY